MAELMGIILIIGFTWWACTKENRTFQKRMPPKGYETDYGKMNHDIVMRGKDEAIRRANRGCYDVPKK